MKVFSTSPFLPASIDRLKELYTFEHYSKLYPPCTHQELLMEKIVDMDGLLCHLASKIDARLIDHARNLRILSTVAVGYDNIDVDAAHQQRQGAQCSIWRSITSSMVSAVADQPTW